MLDLGRGDDCGRGAVILEFDFAVYLRGRGAATDFVRVSFGLELYLKFD